MALINCPECGKEISEQAKFCPNCGFASTPKKFCKFCGEKIDTDCVVCPKCGKCVEEIQKEQQPFIINNSASSSSTTTVPSYNSRKLPWYLSGLWIFILGIFTGGIYWIIGIILRVIWRSHN